MITVVTYKWFNPQGRYNAVYTYTEEHVHKLRSMLKRHLHIPHKLVCVTDDALDLDPTEVEIRPISSYLGLSGTWQKLHFFSPSWIGRASRMLLLDLDCVILDDITPLVQQEGDIVLWKRAQVRNPYNSSMVLYTPGTRPRIWGSYSKSFVDKISEKGGDQEWLSFILGHDEKGFPPGIVKFDPSDYAKPDARIVFFNGCRDPSIYAYPWIKENWR